MEDLEVLDGGPTLFQTFAVYHWGRWDFEFSPLKIARAQRPGLPLGSIVGVSRAHALNFFECAEIRVTQEIGDFRQKIGIFL